MRSPCLKCNRTKMFRTVRHVAMSPGTGFHCLSNTGINHPAKANTKEYCKICSKHLTFQWDPCKVTRKESSAFFIATKKIRVLDHMGKLMGNPQRTWSVRSHVVGFAMYVLWPDGADWRQ